MSMYEQAEKLNTEFKAIISMICAKDHVSDMQDLNTIDLINTIIWFGQVAKFRCRSNTAYKNFCDYVFKDIAELESTTDEKIGFETIHVKKQKVNING